MKILVYGVGAVGGYFAAKFQQAGHEVTAVTNELMSEAIEASGLTVVEDGRSVKTRLNTVNTIAQAFGDQQIYDLIILGMKSYDLESALNPLVAFAPEPPPIITMQNGIGAEKYAIDLFGEENVISGALTIPLNRDTINQIRVEQLGRGLALAPTKPKQKIREWVKLFKSLGIDTKGLKDYEAMKWSKALWNMMGNASSAIVNRPPNILYKSEVMYDLDIRMIQEAVAVMKKHRIKVVDLPGTPVSQLASGSGLFFKRFVISKVVGGRGERMPSFYADISVGRRKNEVVYHNGAVAAAGKAVRIYTPVNKAYNDIVMMLAYKRLNWQDYDGRPQRLLRDVKRLAEQMKQEKMTGQLGDMNE